MNDFTKQVYKNMTSVDRCFLFLGKAIDLIDIARLMTDQDRANMKKMKLILEKMEKKS